MIQCSTNLRLCRGLAAANRLAGGCNSYHAECNAGSQPPPPPFFFSWKFYQMMNSSIHYPASREHGVAGSWIPISRVSVQLQKSGSRQKLRAAASCWSPPSLHRIAGRAPACSSAPTAPSLLCLSPSGGRATEHRARLGPEVVLALQKAGSPDLGPIRAGDKHSRAPAWGQGAAHH